ncbi:hypothetical protein QG37_07152 [Candidozyma auris]|uniref:Uncharacterized protein n=1 Tax=Candidozyma auris TaxID=498019 RepID=A0A0L0NR68_CANAR|nr:hypothetical protein QG37_07152 [[Candida] auris]
MKHASYMPLFYNMPFFIKKKKGFLDLRSKKLPQTVIESPLMIVAMSELDRNM